MRTLLALLFSALIVSPQANFAADAPSSSSKSKPIQQTENMNVPAPPADNEPVFPIHVEPPNAETNKFFMEFLNMLATLGFVIALILIIAWFLKRLVNTRMEQQNVNSAIKVTEKRALSPKTILYLVETDDKKILIAESQNGTTLLTEVAKPLASPENDSTQFPSPFSKLLDRK